MSFTKNRLMPNDIPRWVRIYSNQTDYKFTVVFDGGLTRKVGGRNYYPCLFVKNDGTYKFEEFDFILDTQNGQYPSKIGRKHKLGVRIKFEDLEYDCQMSIVDIYKKLWKI